MKLRFSLSTLWAVCGLALATHGAIPGAEKLLPPETLLMVSVPDFTKARALWEHSAQFQLWNAPEMKPFREGFFAKWDEELVKPLQRECGIQLDSCTNLLQGQVTFAIVQDSAPGQERQPAGVLLLADSKDKSEQLKQTLADLHKKWVEAGRAAKTEKIRNIDFSIISFTTNELPKALQKLLRQPSRFQPVDDGDAAPAPTEAPKPGLKSELVIGQVESLLVVGNTTKVVEQVVARLTGGNAPSLGELAAYQANDQALFRTAPLYGWLNARAFLDILNRQAAEKKGSDSPSPFDSLNPEKLFGAMGLTALNSVAFAVQDSNEGTLFHLFFAAPEAKRRGLTSLLTPAAKESSPPPFVPADTVKFMRWRADGPKAWATVEKMLSDISPQIVGGLNFLLDSAEAQAKEKEPKFDLRKFLIGNLGDDFISYEKAPRGSTPLELQNPPSLLLVGSPKPADLAAALKSLLVIFPQGDTITEREFLGRKIFSVPMPTPPMGLPGPTRPSASAMLNVAASGGYVAISTDTAMLEEYLRSTDTQGKALRETVGLAEAAQKAGGMGTGWFGYENQAETMRATFDAWKRSGASSSASSAANPLASLVPMPTPLKTMQEWMDFSLLPPFEKVSKYFGFSVYAVSANGEGLSYKLFSPVPPALRK
jgi:hypothetical protein